MKHTPASFSMSPRDLSWIRLFASIFAFVTVAGAETRIPQSLARPTRPPSDRVPMPAEAPVILTMMTEFANADLFDTSMEKKLPRAERWRCVRGDNFEIFDQSRLLDTEDFGRAFSNYTDIYKKMTGPFALPSGYKIEVLALDKQDSDDMKLPSINNIPGSGNSSYDHMIVLTGYIRYEYDRPFPSSSWGGMGWGGYSSSWAYYRGGGLYDRHDSFGYTGSRYWPGGFHDYPGRDFYDPFPPTRIPVSARSWTTDLLNASRGYNYAVIARNRKYAGHVLKSGLDDFLLMQRISDRGLTSSIFNYGLYNSKESRQYSIIPMKDLFSRGHELGIATGVRRSTSFVFTHMCLGSFDNSYKWGDAYLAFLSKTAGVREITESMFMECFGVGFEEMDALLEAHAQSLRKTPKTWSVSYTYKKPVRLIKRDWATDAEVGRMKARLYMAAAEQVGRDVATVERGSASSQYRKESVERTHGSWDAYVKTKEQHIRNARLEILARFKRGTADAQLLKTAGDWEFAHGDHSRGRRYYMLAAKAGVESSDVYLSLAKWVMQENLPADGRSIDKNNAMLAMAVIKRGMEFAPERRDLFEELITVIEKSSLAFSADVGGSFLRMALRFRYDHDLIYRMANLVVQRGSLEDAQKLIELGLKSTYRPEILARFERIGKGVPANIGMRIGDSGRDLRVAQIRQSGSGPSGRLE